MGLFSLDPGSPVKALAGGAVTLGCAFVLDRFCDALAASASPSFRSAPAPPAAAGVCDGLLTPALWAAAAGIAALLIGLALARWAGDLPAVRSLRGAAFLLSRLIALALLVATLVALLTFNFLDPSLG